MVHIEELLVRSIGCLRAVLREAPNGKGITIVRPGAQTVIQLDRTHISLWLNRYNKPMVHIEGLLVRSKEGLRDVLCAALNEEGITIVHPSYMQYSNERKIFC